LKNVNSYHTITPAEQGKSAPVLSFTGNAKESAMKFVVIGGDAAGMSAASRAKRNRPELG